MVNINIAPEENQKGVTAVQRFIESLKGAK